jgi:hypothetical protein
LLLEFEALATEALATEALAVAPSDVFEAVAVAVAAALSVVLDEEALLKPESILHHRKDVFCGPVRICRHDLSQHLPLLRGVLRPHAAPKPALAHVESAAVEVAAVTVGEFLQHLLRTTFVFEVRQLPAAVPCCKTWLKPIWAQHNCGWLPPALTDEVTPVFLLQVNVLQLIEDDEDEDDEDDEGDEGGADDETGDEDGDEEDDAGTTWEQHCG